MADVIITPASGLIDFQNVSGISSATIQLDGNGNLALSAAGGDIQIGDTSSDIFIGDGINNVDLIFEEDGEIRGLTGKTITLGQSDSFISFAGDITGNITVTGTVDGRDVASDGSKLDGIESGATADQTAAEILTLIKTVDGAGSGLDADTVDGISSASFLRSDAADTATGQILFASARTDFGSSGNWNAVGFSNVTNLHPRDHDNFWFGAGNGTWFTGTANSQSQASGLAADVGSAHDLLLSTMQSDVNYDRGITFAVDSTGAGNSGWRLGKWHSGDARDSSKFVVDGQIFGKAGNTDEYDYYTNDYSAYYSSQGGQSHWPGDSGYGWHTPGVVSSSAIQIQSGNAGTNTRKPQIQFHQYGYGGPAIEYDGPNDTLNIIGPTSRLSNTGFKQQGNTIWHAGNDGAGSGLDADTLDGISSASFLRSDASDTYSSGTLTFGTGTALDLATNDVYASFRVFRNSKSGGDGLFMGYGNNNSGLTRIYGGGSTSTHLSVSSSGMTFGGSTVWHAGNDGSGSGLDADLLDGAQPSVSASNSTIVQRHSSGYIYANFFNTTPNDVTSGVTKVLVETGNDGFMRHGTADAIRSFINVESGATADQTASEILTAIKTVDGAGSGLDADLLDGISSASFLRSDANDSFTGELYNGSLNQNPAGGNGAIQLQPSTSGGSTGIFFNSRVNANSDGAYIWWYDDNNNYRKTDSSENGALVIGIQNDGNSTAEDAIAIESSGDIFLNPGNDGGFGNAGGVTGPDFAEGKVYIGRASTRYEVWHAGNDGSGSGLDADTLDGQQGSSFLRSNASDEYRGGTLNINSDSSNGHYVGWGLEYKNSAWRHTNASSWGHAYRNSGGFLDIYVAKEAGTADSVATYRALRVGGSSQLLQYDGNNVWHAGNDGAGSGLDADTIDGTQLSNLMTLSGTQTVTGDKDFDGTLTYDLINGPNTSTRTKIRVYSSGAYAIGMQSGITFGGLNDWGMTFQFNNENDRGFWWGDDGHSTAQGAMALTTDGKLSVAHSLRIGYGESDTTIPGATHRLDVSGSAFFTNGDGAGAVFTSSSHSSDSLYIGGWSTANSNDIARIRTSNNLHIDSQANGNLYFNWYASNRTIYLGNTGQTVRAAGSNIVWHAGNDGSGSGLDADLLDGISSASFLRSDADDTVTGRTKWSLSATDAIKLNKPTTTSYTGISFFEQDDLRWLMYVSNNADGTFNLQARKNGANVKQVFSVNQSTGIINFSQSSATIASNTIWHAGNDGAGSGLDADTVDGIQADRIPYGSNTSGTTGATNPGQNLRSGFFDVYGTASGAPTNTWYSYINIRHTNTSNGWGHQIAGSFYDNGDLYNRHYDSGNYAGWTKIWNAANDGAGSGLDADLLDGQQGSYYLNYNNFTNTPTIPTNNNQLTNGAGYITSFDITTQTDPKYLRSNAGDQYDGQTSGRVLRFRCVDNRNAATTSGSQFPLEIYQNVNGTNSDAAMAFHISGRYATYFGLDRETNDLFVGGWSKGAAKYKIWHAGNDGSGSGLDADLLDGENLVDNAATANTVAGRNGSGDMYARLFRSTYGNQSTISGGMVFRVNNSTDNYLRVCNDTSAIRTFLNVPTRTGGDASGTWGINITGSAASATTATTATNCSRSVIAGNGLTGGGQLNANRTLNVGAGSGISVAADTVAVDSTVVRTTGNQSISGEKTFNNDVETNKLLVGTSVAPTGAAAGTLVVEDSIQMFNSGATDNNGRFQIYVGEQENITATTGTIRFTFSTNPTTDRTSALLKITVSWQLNNNNILNQAAIEFMAQINNNNSGVVAIGDIQPIYEYRTTVASDVTFTNLNGGQCRFDVQTVVNSSPNATYKVEVLARDGKMDLSAVSKT